MITSAEKPDYDAREHITAGQLRRLGFYLCELISDRAYVRRVAVGLSARERFNDGSATLCLCVAEPFVSN
jgi:hypothetical protein